MKTISFLLGVATMILAYALIETAHASNITTVGYLSTVTAYSSYETCPSGYCITASRKNAYIGSLACPRSIELGTKVCIDEVEYTCEDRTALKYNGRFDLWMGHGKQNWKRALKFGKQQKEVTIGGCANLSSNSK